MTAFRSQIQLFVNKNLSQAANQQRLQEIAKQKLAETISSGKASTTYNTYVDGAKTDDISSAQKRIYYEFVYLSQAASFALGFLQARSPNKSGLFIRSFWVSIDNHYYAPGTFNLNDIGDAQEIIIGNTQPYNRKIDVQLVGRRVLRFSQPAGIYDDTVRAVMSKFRGNLTAKRVYDMNFPGRYRQKTAGYRFQSPAIIISRI